jgi:hypothetical protein
MNRRDFLSACMSTAAVVQASSVAEDPPRQPAFATRGVVLLPEDLTLSDWPERAKNAGLTTIGIHHQNSPRAVMDWIQSEPGQRFLEQCRKLGLAVEYELHAMKELLPRNLFEKHPELFRMNSKGQRTLDCNCCVHAGRALDFIAENALAIAKVLRPTTGRYFFWGDDGQPWCSCPKCRDLSPSEQATTIENCICRALRKQEGKAQVAHLAYQNTLAPPKNVKPDAALFLEYAPINRRYDLPYERQDDPKRADGLHAVDANLQVFPKNTAQVLEYWLDVSRFSKWRRPAVKLPWNRDVFRADVETYRKRGIRHVTTFAAWIDADYQKRFGDLGIIGEYGEGLRAGAG